MCFAEFVDCSAEDSDCVCSQDSQTKCHSDEECELEFITDGGCIPNPFPL
jgi:hypothetical protein